jgi:hypothetical protein
MRAMNMGMLEAHQAWAPKGGLGGGKGRLVCLAVTACNTGSYSSGCELFKGAQERDGRCAWLRAAGCGSLACVLSIDCKCGGLGGGEGRLRGEGEGDGDTAGLCSRGHHLRVSSGCLQDAGVLSKRVGRQVADNMIHEQEKRAARSCRQRLSLSQPASGNALVPQAHRSLT